MSEKGTSKSTGFIYNQVLQQKYLNTKNVYFTHEFVVYELNLNREEIKTRKLLIRSNIIK